MTNSADPDQFLKKPADLDLYMQRQGIMWVQQDQG